jgi:hypothetical protein
LDGASGARKSPLFTRRLFQKFFETCRAYDTVIMFGNAFTAEESVTLGTMRHRFPRGMVETTRLGKVHHVC